MDEKNEELVDAQIVEEDSRMYGHAEGEPGGEVADEPALVLGDDHRIDEELLDAMQDSMLEAMIAAEESGNDEQEGGPECTS